MQDVQIVQVTLLVVVLVSLVCPMTCRRRAMVVTAQGKGPVRVGPVRMPPFGGCYGRFADGCPLREKDTGNIHDMADTANGWARNAADRSCRDKECERVTGWRH